MGQHYFSDVGAKAVLAPRQCWRQGGASARQCWPQGSVGAKAVLALGSVGPKAVLAQRAVLAPRRCWPQGSVGAKGSAAAKAVLGMLSVCARCRRAAHRSRIRSLVFRTVGSGCQQFSQWARLRRRRAAHRMQTYTGRYKLSQPSSRSPRSRWALPALHRSSRSRCHRRRHRRDRRHAAEAPGARRSVAELRHFLPACRHVYRHVYGRVYSHVYRHVHRRMGGRCQARTRARGPSRPMASSSTARASGVCTSFPK